MTNTVEDLPRLNAAIGTVSKEVLAALLRVLCEKDPTAREFMKANLFVDENEVPQPGTPPIFESDTEESEADSDDEDKEDVKHPSTTTTTGPKRLRPRYAFCINCKEEFDVAGNTQKSCSYHPYDDPEPDEDMFADHEECTHGPIDTEENRSAYPGSFIYGCCDRHGDEEPCITDWHREVEYESSKRRKF